MVAASESANKGRAVSPARYGAAWEFHRWFIEPLTSPSYSSPGRGQKFVGPSQALLIERIQVLHILVVDPAG